MRYLKSLIIAAFAFAMAAGTLLAADDPLEIHGGGRAGVVVNSKLGGGTGNPYLNNDMGSMPNYAQSHYFGLTFSKKTTADGGAWAKVQYSLDNGVPDLTQDCQNWTPRTRDFHVEFGGLDFMPAGAVLWGGLTNFNLGWDGMQDHSFVCLAGVGFGIKNIGGVASINYVAYDFGGAVAKLGNRKTHHVIGTVNLPMIDIIASVGYAKKASGQPNDKAYSEFLAGALYHAPVYGLNIGAVVATNCYAGQMFYQEYDTYFKNHGGDMNTSGAFADKHDKAMAVRLSAFTVTDLAPGLYTATAFRYQMISLGKLNPRANTGGAKTNTDNKIDFTTKISKSLTKNIAFCPVFGFLRNWDKEKKINAKPLQVFQITPALEIGLDTGYWASQKIQFYGTYSKVDTNHKFVGGAFDGKNSSMAFGTLITFGF